MLFAWYGHIVGAGIIAVFALPFLASLITHACCRRYLLVVAVTTICGLVLWTTLGLLAQDDATSETFDAILFAAISWGIMSAVAGVPFAIVRRFQVR